MSGRFLRWLLLFGTDPKPDVYVFPISLRYALRVEVHRPVSRRVAAWMLRRRARVLSRTLLKEAEAEMFRNPWTEDVVFTSPVVVRRRFGKEMALFSLSEFARTLAEVA